MPTFSIQLEQTLHHALALANERHNQYSSLYHLLLAFTFDESVQELFQACKVDVDQLRTSLTNYLETEYETIKVDNDQDAKPTQSFQRALQRAVIHAQSSGRDEVTSHNVIVAIFADREEHAAEFLEAQDMTRYDAVKFISQRYAAQKHVKSTAVTILSGPKDADLEKWLSDVLGSAGIAVTSARLLAKPGAAFSGIFDRIFDHDAIICILSPEFRRSAIYSALVSQPLLRTFIEERVLIPIVIGPPVEAPPISEIVQIDIGDSSESELSSQILSALDFSGPVDLFPELFAQALTRIKNSLNSTDNREVRSQPEAKSDFLAGLPGSDDFGWRGSILIQHEFPTSDLHIGNAKIEPKDFFRDFSRLVQEIDGQITLSNHSSTIKAQASLLLREVSCGPSIWDPQTVDRRIRALSELLPSDDCPMADIVRIHLRELRLYQHNFRKIYPIIADRERLIDTLEIPTDAPLAQTNQIAQSLEQASDLVHSSVPHKLTDILDELQSVELDRTRSHPETETRRRRAVAKLAASLKSIWQALQNPPELVKKLDSYQKLYEYSKPLFRAVWNFFQ
ncbi:hypothetical protein KQX63_18260 [Rhodopseudomonas palustris]|nr:hypothetical protein KQX63_18260 [Rhodopseudomonas palustris]